MSTAPTVSPSAAKVHSLDKFSSAKTAHGDVTVLTLRGTLNEGFDGRKLANSIRTKKVVMVMRDVRRIASWGMAEWMDFLRVLGDRDVYLIECSTYATSQLNLVTGLLGHAKLVSFYAGQRCRSCNTSSESLVVIPAEREAIHELPRRQNECAKCGGSVRIEEYPAAFFDTIADRVTFDIADDVLELLRTRFKYEISPDVERFRAGALVQDELTYLRLLGNLNRVVPEKLADASQGTTIVDLEGVRFDGSGVEAWRAYMDTAIPKLKAMQLVHCPSGFLENAITTADLRNRLKVRSFAMAYECVRCQTSSAHLVDVAETLEDLVQGHLPSAACATCQTSLVPLLTPGLLSRLKALPARDRDPVLEKFFAKARNEGVGNLDDVLVHTAKRAPATKPEPGRRGLFAVLGVIVVLLGGITWFVMDGWRKQNVQRVVVATADAGPAKPTFVRPDWITSDAPSSAYCLDMINRISCVGISSYRPNRDDAVADANDAALDEAVYAIGLRITEPFFTDGVANTYAEGRSKILSDLHAAEVDRASPDYAAALAAVVDARHRVVQALRASGGPAVPTQRSDWYWEEYAAEPGKPHEQLVFVRYDIGLDAMRSMVTKYSAITTVSGAGLVTAFPGLAWQFPTLVGGGAMVVKVTRPLARAGVVASDVILFVDGTPVTDVAQLERHLQDAAQAGHGVELGVASGTNPVKSLAVRL